MTIERNLLRLIIPQIAKEYAPAGWLIEAVDLRWGISREAGLDNRTMRICLEELRRCRELSPKPNFIILLGQRHGWIPLPETIPTSDYVRLSMNRQEQDLFFQWYRLDENTLHEATYILQPRTGPYADDSRWSNDVETPLRNMFMRNSSLCEEYAMSATEKEIVNGALDVDDAKEHVLAYIRHLHDIPATRRSAFIDSESHAIHRLDSLKRKLHDKLSADNIYAAECAFEEYQSESFASLFKDAMTRHLRSIIDSTIKNAETVDGMDENKQHVEIAKAKSESFIGRADILKIIDDYVNDADDRRTLWVKGPSGSGKSSIMARTVRCYGDTHDIICRFCGETERSTDGLSFIKSLWDEIRRYDMSGRLSHLKIGNGFFSISPEEGFKSIISRIKLRRPLLIVIDAIDQLQESTCNGLSRLTWLDSKLDLGIKIIISTTDDYKFNFELPNLRILPLPSMGADASRMVMSILHRHDRTLSEKQSRQLDAILDRSDRSAIYLEILGHYLSQAESWVDISSSPTDLTGLVCQIVDRLSRPERHGDKLVKTSLRLLCAERIGLNDSEMLDLLDNDQECTDSIQATSFHQIDPDCGHSVPAIYWSRLHHDLLPLLRSKMSLAGTVTTFFHNAIRLTVEEIVLNDHSTKTVTYSSLYFYYKDKIAMSDRHALLECAPALFAATSSWSYVSPMIFRLFRDGYESLLCHNTDYILNKRALFPTLLIDDYNRGTGLYQDDNASSLLEMRNRVADLPDGLDAELLRTYLHNLPSDSPLRQLSESSTDDDTRSILFNALADSMPDDPTIHAIDSFGAFPHISADGNAVASVFDNGHTVKVKNLVNPSKSITYRFEKEISDLKCDDSLRYHLLTYDNECLLYDSVGNKTVCRFSFESSPYIDIAGSGNVITCGADGQHIIYQVDCDRQIDASCITDARLSHDGRYAWIILDNGVLVRYDISADTSISFPIEYPGGNAPTKIHAASCDLCLAGSILFKHYQIDGKDKFTHYDLQRFVYNAHISDDERKVFIQSQPHSISIFNISDEIFVTNKSCPKIFAMNDKFVLLGSPPRIAALDRQLETGFIPDAYNAGLNSFSCDCSGRRIIISSGINHVQESMQETIIYTDANVRKMHKPPFHNGYSYVSASAISPDGKLFGASSESPGNEAILCKAPSFELLVSQQELSCGCISQCFSDDSRYMLAATGHFIADPKLEIAICDCEKRLFCYFKDLDDRLYNKGGIRFLSDNRHILFPAGYHIFDLVENRIINQDGIACHDCDLADESNMVKACRGTVIEHPYKPLMLSVDHDARQLLTFDLEAKILHRSPCPYLLAAITPDAAMLFFIGEGTLYFAAYGASDRYTRICDNVRNIYPALDARHIFIYRIDGELLLFDLSAMRVIRRACFPGLWDAKICASGLLAVDSQGNCARFEAVGVSGFNRPAITSFVRRWDIFEKTQSQPTAICPMCGHVIHLSSTSGMIPGADTFCPACASPIRFNPYIK